MINRERVLISFPCVSLHWRLHFLLLIGLLAIAATPSSSAPAGLVDVRPLVRPLVSWPPSASINGSGRYPIRTETGLGPVFTGIGGLSAGASSRLLIDYEEPYRSVILDALFKPGVGASLSVLKVEIGGDVQSTDGTESSHMQRAEDEDFTRGYEWWLMREAKRRNPEIVTFALSWGFPHWLANAEDGLPFNNRTVHYVVTWLKAARDVHGVEVDYVGIWNERAYNTEYVKWLYGAIKEAGLSTKVSADDGFSWQPCVDAERDQQLNLALASVGNHYPQTSSLNACHIMTWPLPVWASEDFSTDYRNGHCWARTLSHNWLNGYMSATISWPLISSWYDQLPFGQQGLMHGASPWSGHFDISSPFWASAHHTAFTPGRGWRLLLHNSGTFHLTGGGSIVSYTDRTQRDLTIVIESMTWEDSRCYYGNENKYTLAESQTVTLILSDSFSHIQSFFMFASYFSINETTSKSVYLQYLQEVVVNNDRTIQLTIGNNTLLTLSTINVTRSIFNPPADKRFKLPYFANYTNTSSSHNVPGQHAPYWSDQVGSFLFDKDGGIVQQVTETKPVTWCSEGHYPLTLMTGNAEDFSGWGAANISIHFSFDAQSSAQTIIIGAQVSKGGCGLDTAPASGIFCAFNEEGTLFFSNSSNLDYVVAPMPVSMSSTEFAVTSILLRLSVFHDHAECSYNNMITLSTTLFTSTTYPQGFLALGSSYTRVRIHDVFIDLTTNVSYNSSSAFPNAAGDQLEDSYLANS